MFQLLVTAPLMVAWGLIVFVGHVWGLYVGRALTGACVGIVSVAAPMYLSEIAENSIRGTLGTFFQLQLTVGVLIAYIVGKLTQHIFSSLEQISSNQIINICPSKMFLIPFSIFEFF